MARRLVEIMDIKALKVGVEVVVKYSDGSLCPPFKHTIRERVVKLKKDNTPTLESETNDEYNEYKLWLKGRFKRRELYVEQEEAEDIPEPKPTGGSQGILGEGWEN